MLFLLIGKEQESYGLGKGELLDYFEHVQRGEHGNHTI